MPPTPALPRGLAPPRSLGQPTSTVGPLITLVGGLVLLAVAIVVGVLSARTTVGDLATDVLSGDGSAGPGVVGTVAAPGTGHVRLPPGRTYDIYLVTDTGRDTSLADTLRVTDYEDTTMPVDGGAAGRYVEAGPSRAELVGSVETARGMPDRYTFHAPGTSDGLGGTLHLVNADDRGPVVNDRLGGVYGTLGAVVLGGIALTLVVLGWALWAVRRSNARRAGPV